MYFWLSNHSNIQNCHCGSQFLQKSKWTVVTSPPALCWSTLEQFGGLLLWAAFSCSTLMALSAAFMTTWHLVCLATTRMSCWKRLTYLNSCTAVWIGNHMDSLLSLLLCQQSITFLMPGFYGWVSDSDRKASSFSDSQGEAIKSTAPSKISEKFSEYL